MTKKKIGELEGTPIVTGEKNYANEHEYYMTLNGDNTYQKLEQRTNGDQFKLVLGGGSGSEGGISNVKIAYPIRTLMINDGTDFLGLVYKKADFETANLLLTVVYGESKPMYIEYITILPRTDNNISIVNELSNNGLTQYKDMSTDEGVPDWVKKYFLLYPDISENSGENTNLYVASTPNYDLQEDEIALFISRSYPG